MAGVEEQLLGAIADKLNHDGPRLVYGDWLSERGEPRGEFIHLQVLRAASGTQTPEQAEREKALLEAGRDRWLGDLRDAVTDVRFERGFPASFTLRTGDEAVLRRLAGHPGWATAYELRCDRPYRGSSDALVEVIGHPVMRNLKRLDGTTTETLNELTRDGTRPYEYVRFHLWGYPNGVPGWSPQDLEALARLPGLTRLGVDVCYANSLYHLCKSRVGERVPELAAIRMDDGHGNRDYGGGIETFLALVDASPFARFDFYDEAFPRAPLRFTRDREGKLSILEGFWPVLRQFSLERLPASALSHVTLESHWFITFDPSFEDLRRTLQRFAGLALDCYRDDDLHFGFTRDRAGELSVLSVAAKRSGGSYFLAVLLRLLECLPPDALTSFVLVRVPDEDSDLDADFPPSEADFLELRAALARFTRLEGLELPPV